MRDSQKAKVYGAEDHVRRTLDLAGSSGVRQVQVFGSTVVLPDERRFGDVAGVQRYVDSVLALNWVRDLWPDASARKVTVRARKGITKAHYCDCEIAVPSDERQAVRKSGWAMREIIVLHEISHHLAPGVHHGPEFVGVFLHLVEEIMGPEVGLLLYSALHEAGATLRKPFPRPA